MKKFIIKNLIKKNGFFDRKLLIKLMDLSYLQLVKFFWKKSIIFLYIKWNRLMKPKTKKQTPYDFYAFQMNKFYGKIGFFSKIKAKFNWR